jgi:hypothetical protein
MQNSKGEKLSSLYHNSSSAGSMKLLHVWESWYSEHLSLLPICSHISWRSSRHCNARLVAVMSGPGHAQGRYLFCANNVLFVISHR